MKLLVFLLSLFLAMPLLSFVPTALADDLDLSQFGHELEPGETPDTNDPNIMVVSDPHASDGSRSTDPAQPTGPTPGVGTAAGPQSNAPYTVDIPTSFGSSTTTPYTFYPGGLPPATSDNPALNTSGEIWRAFTRDQISRDDYIRRMRELQEKERAGRARRGSIDAQDVQESSKSPRTKRKSESNES